MKTLKFTHRYQTLCVALVVAILNVPATAASVWHVAKIVYIYPQGSGDVVLTFETDAPTCTNVNTPKYCYIRVGENGVTREGLENMLAVALTVATTGRAVTINFDDAGDGCFIGRLIVSFRP